MFCGVMVVNSVLVCWLVGLLHMLCVLFFCLFCECGVEHVVVFVIVWIV